MGKTEKGRNKSARRHRRRRKKEQRRKLWEKRRVPRRGGNRSRSISVRLPPERCEERVKGCSARGAGGGCGELCFASAANTPSHRLDCPKLPGQPSGGTYMYTYV